MTIEQWQVYHVPNCRHTRPVPKNKYVVIACIEGGVPYGFFINSAVNAYVQARPFRLACEAQIFGAEHHFLSHDSWVDCQDIHPYTIHELSDLRGSLSAPAVAAVLTAVGHCRVLQRRYKRLIVEQAV